MDSGQWTPGRSDLKALKMLGPREGTEIPQEAIGDMLATLDVHHLNRMDGRLVALLVDSGAAQDLPSVAALPEAQEALRVVADLVRAVAGQDAKAPWWRRPAQ
ncbi:hypothetical protein [Streptomyces sp. JJ38]|uniref:hypothetical protein n=1 Tax=Streptomyces sp. JJ38 TaxID=2738128 RepID=UPI001C559B6F|nr:hypothetical protein [Streptomyces sp. JJ38]MBW1597261.1 hypothetical protein [Streptomyces sp. JJ38]